MAGAKYFPPAVRGTFSSPKTGPTRFPSDGKSLARCKPPSENDEMEFSFSKRLLSFFLFFSFVSFFFFIFHFARSTASTRGGAPADAHCVSPPLLPFNTQLVDSPAPPMASACPTIGFTARVQRSKGHAQSDTRWKYDVGRGEARRGGNYQAHRVFRVCRNDRLPGGGKGGLFPLTRKIVGNCWREGRKEKSTFRQPLSIAHLSSKFLFSLSSDSLSLSLVSTTLSGQSLSGKCGKLERKWIPPHNREESYNSRLGKRGRGL